MEHPGGAGETGYTRRANESRMNVILSHPLVGVSIVLLEGKSPYRASVPKAGTKWSSGRRVSGTCVVGLYYGHPAVSALCREDRRVADSCRQDRGKRSKFGLGSEAHVRTRPSVTSGREPFGPVRGTRTFRDACDRYRLGRRSVGNFA